MPSPGDELMLYQMIVSAWPIESADLRAFTDRLAEWQLKAMREAKLETDWDAPNTDYEEAARSFLNAIMTASDFVAEAQRFVSRIGPPGAVNGLAQTLLKMTVPGVPDFYQGTEFWDQSLVDPDNRRPVDFARRIEALDADATPAALMARWQDGRVKQAMVRRVLALRHAAPDLFARGNYRPLTVTGELADHVVAFARSSGDQHCIVVVPRLRTADGGTWLNTNLHIPDDLAAVPMRQWLSDDAKITFAPRMPVGDLLRDFPVALLATR